MEIIIKILGTALFFLPGAGFVWLIYRKINLSALVAYTIIFSVFLSTLSVFALFQIGFLSFINILMVNIVLGFVGLLLIFFLKDKCKVVFDKNFFAVLLGFTIFGSLWRHLFKLQVFRWADGITSHIETVLIEKVFYNGGLIQIPNAGFYTGLIAGRAEIISGQLSNFYYSLIGFSGFFATFFTVYLLLFFTYKVIFIYRNNNTLALLGAFIVGSVGVGEIWSTTIGLTEVLLSYPAFISLFIILKERSREFFVVTLALVIAISLTYYTGIIVLMFASSGFIFAFIISGFLEKSGFPKYIFRYIILLFICLFSLFVLTGEILTENTFVIFGGIMSKVGEIFETDTFKRIDRFGELDSGPVSGVVNTYQYQYKILSITMLSWQNLFLLAIALSFFMSIYFKIKTRVNLLEEYRDIMIAMLPAIIVGLSFLLINMVQRSFVYLSFFPFLICHFPKEKILRYLIISIMVVLFVVSGFFHNIDRVLFHSFTKTEIEGAKWASQNLKGLVISDQRFITLLMENDYYNIDGFLDNSSFTETFFYQEDIKKIKKAFSMFEADYFITTKMMRESYILMASFHQKPMGNNDIYEDNLLKIYDNGDVRIYKIEKDD